MPPKRKSPWSRKRRAPLAPSFIVAIGLAATVLIFAFVLQRTLPRRDTVAERLPPPDFAGLLPPGAEAGAGGALELSDLPQSSYVVGYKAADGTISVALITWERRSNKYRVSSTLPLATGDARLESVPTLDAVALGRGAPVAVLAKGSAGAYTDGVFVLVRQGDALSYVAKRDASGNAGVAFFLSGASVRHGEEIDFGDVDGDGKKEAVATASDTDEHGVRRRTVSVYVLRDNFFNYDQELSRILTLSRSVFPEPVAPPIGQ